MTALVYLLKCMLYFVCVALDITMLFLQVRLILRWRKIQWLIPLDKAGQPLVAAITEKVSALLKTRQPLSENGKLVLALVTVVIARIILGILL